MAKRKLPETSLEAYASLEPEKLREIYQQIISALTLLKKGTFEDVSAHLKIDRDRVWKRLPELEKMGFVCRHGSKKKLRSGREGYEWTLTLNSTPTVQDISRNMQSITKEYQQLKLI